MEPNQPSSTPNMPPAPTPVSTPNPIDYSRPKKVGPIVTTLVVVLILIIAALYFFASRINTPPVPMDNAGTIAATDTDQTSVKPVTSKADDPASLQSDLNASTNGLDQQNF